MKALKYILLLLFLLNLATFTLTYVSPNLGSLLSSVSFLALIVYYFFSEKGPPVFPFIILGLGYFVLSSLNYTGPTDEFIKDAVKYFLLVVMALELIRVTTNNELLIILGIGTMSIIINGLVFPNLFGRYSGFYINPNRAGFICLVGFALAFNLQNKTYQLLLQFIFIIAGIMTLSRYFILLLVVINLVSVIANKKNFLGFFIGGIVLLIVFNMSSFQLNSERLSALKSIFSDDVDTNTITKESRQETWALYTDKISKSPIIGNGYRSMQGNKKSANLGIGVHNTYLMIIGESGIVPFLLIIIIYLSLLVRSIRLFYENPVYTYLAFILLTNLLVTHNYFDNYITLIMSIWLYVNIKGKSNSTQSIIA